MSEFEDEVGSVGVDIVGTCTRMCSEDECRDREVFYEVSVFEATAETVRLPPNKRRIDRQKAIKKYRRSAAGTKNAQDATLLKALSTLGLEQAKGTEYTEKKSNNSWIIALPIQMLLSDFMSVT